MNVKELQIGDLVDYRGKVIKVTSLYSKNGSNEVGFGDREDCWVNGNVLKPIELTDEILQKNFAQMGDAYVLFDDYYDIEIVEYNDCVYKLNYTYNEVNMPRAQVTEIAYVHQLQHALQMVGVERDIII